MPEDWKSWVNNPSKHPMSTQFSPFAITRVSNQYGKVIPDTFHPELENNTLLRHILYRKSLSQNTFVACVGAVRSGKSYFCLKFAELYHQYTDTKFDVEKQCSFDILHFLKWSRNAVEKAYVLDEVQLQMSPREWFDTQHKVFNTFCDIQGLRKNILLMPFPNISYIDKHLRFLINYIVRTLHQGKILWYKINTLHELGKSFLNKIGTIKFDKPSDKTIEAYEKQKKQFTDFNLDESIELMENVGTPTENEILKQRNLELTVKQKENWEKRQQFREYHINDRGSICYSPETI